MASLLNDIRKDKTDMICKTKEEANEKLRELREEMGFKFCPVIFDKCVSNCMCYEGGRVLVHKDEFAVREPACTHVLISGTIYIEE